MDRKQYMQIRKAHNLAINNFALPIHYFFETLLIGSVALIWVYLQNTFYTLFAIPIVSAIIFRNFSLMHEAVHLAVSKSSRLNDIVGLISGSICLLPFEPWKKSHLEHHLWTGNVERDPVMAIIKFLPSLNPRFQSFLSACWRLWIPTLSIMQYGVFYFLAAKIYLAKRDSIRVLISLCAPLILWGFLFTLLPTSFTLIILLPALILYMIAVEIVNFPHHLQLQQYAGDAKFALWDQHHFARSCTYPKWFARWVVLNFNYHIEHHMFPDVPWYHLDKLHISVKSALTDSYNSDEQFAWILANKPKELASVVSLPQPPKVVSKAS